MDVPGEDRPAGLGQPLRDQGLGVVAGPLRRRAGSWFRLAIHGRIVAGGAYLAITRPPRCRLPSSAGVRGRSAHRTVRSEERLRTPSAAPVDDRLATGHNDRRKAGGQLSGSPGDAPSTVRVPRTTLTRQISGPCAIRADHAEHGSDPATAAGAARPRVGVRLASGSASSTDVRGLEPPCGRRRPRESITTRVWRFERGQPTNLRLEDIWSHREPLWASIVSLRAFPAGDAIRDVASCPPARAVPARAPPEPALAHRSAVSQPWRPPGVGRGHRPRRPGASAWKPRR